MPFISESASSLTYPTDAAPVAVIVHRNERLAVPPLPSETCAVTVYVPVVVGVPLITPEAVLSTMPAGKLVAE